MNILGLACYYHDSSAALINDGVIVAAAEEERFTRKKHDNRFPEEAVAYLLKEAGLNIGDIDLICYYEKPLRKLERILYAGKCWGDKSDRLAAQQLSQAVHEHIFIDQVVKSKLGYEGKVLYAEHHLAHAASSFYVSGFKEAAILTVDGVGEWTTTGQFIGSDKSITKLREIHYPHSLGLLYSTVTAFLGFKVNDGEYKVMGLASYGEPRYKDNIYKLLSLYDDGSFLLNLEYFSFMYDNERMYSDRFIELFGTQRFQGEPITSYHQDIAASLQSVLEEAVVLMGRSLYSKTGMKNVCLAGGVFLNCAANSKFIENTPFTACCIQPASGDAGASLGAALYAHYCYSDRPRDYREHNTLLGPDFSNDEIKAFLDSANAVYTEFNDDELIKKAAELVFKNKIIGWFQGRMELGPRALGNRSILANACNPEMKDILNNRVKFREDFRPFAPAVLLDKAEEYFELSFESPYMLFLAGVKSGKKHLIPSVTHVDGTARVQTVSGNQNPRFYRLIEEFERLSGIPVVINTSFNVRGEPIVCTPSDGFNCFMRTDIDFLLIGNYIVEKDI